MYSCILHNSIIDVVCPPREKSLRHWEPRNEGVHKEGL
jgi:hypothetical protein